MVLSIIGDLIGAAGSLIGGNAAAKAQAKANKAQLDFQKNFIKYRVGDAKEAGIHPLAALGASANYSPMAVTGMADAITQAGAMLGDGIKSMVSQKAKAPMENLQMGLIQSNIDTNKAQADLYRAQALNVAQEARNAALGAVGGKMRPINLEQEVTMPDGRKVKTVDPQLGMDWGEWSNTVARHYGQAWLDQLLEYSKKQGQAYDARKTKQGYIKIETKRGTRWVPAK